MIAVNARRDTEVVTLVVVRPESDRGLRRPAYLLMLPLAAGFGFVIERRVVATGQESGSVRIQYAGETDPLTSCGFGAPRSGGSVDAVELADGVAASGSRWILSCRCAPS